MARARFVPDPAGVARAAAAEGRLPPTIEHADIVEGLRPADGGASIGLARMVLGSPEGIILKDILSRHDKVAVTGASGSGKSSLCSVVARDHVIVGTDQFGFGEGVGSRIASATCAHAKAIVEGVLVPRALRRGLKSTALLVLVGSHKALNPRSMGTLKSMITVLEECDRMRLMDDVEVWWVHVNTGAKGLHLAKALRIIKSG